MLFVMFATAYPERYSDLFHLLKHMRIPEGVEIVKKLELFGKPDIVMLFEANNEHIAAKFVEQFGKVGNVSTYLAREARE